MSGELKVTPPQAPMLGQEYIPNSKEDSFLQLQMDWFQRPMHGNETITLTRDQLKLMHDHGHERGCLQERALHEVK